MRMSNPVILKCSGKRDFTPEFVREVCLSGELDTFTYIHKWF